MEAEAHSGELRSRLIKYVCAKFSSRPNICCLSEDIVQQAFSEVPEEKWCFPYMAAVCVHIGYRFFKRLDFEGKVTLDGIEYLWFMDDTDVVKELICRQDAKEILDSLWTLREIERIIITQRYYGDYSFAEIAENNGIRLNTVLSHHRRALEKLRPHLSAFSHGRTKRKSCPTEKNRSVVKKNTDKGGLTNMIQKDSFNFGVLAERAHRLAFDIAMQSGQLGEDGHGIAVVADECRTIGIRLKKAADHLLAASGEGPNIEAEVRELEMLSVNGMIEALRVSDSENGAHCSRQLAVIFDELCSLAADFREWSGQKIVPHVWLEACPKSSVLHKRMPFLLMKIKGVEYTENIRLVDEVLRMHSDAGQIDLRGQNVQVADISGLPGTVTESEIMVIVHKGFDEEGIIAVPVDCLPSVFWSNPGVNSGKEDFLRECWNCEEGNKMRFPDYEKLI